MRRVGWISFVLALAAVGTAYGQTPGAMTTCSQVAAYCTKGCPTDSRTAQAKGCPAGCQARLDNCLQTGSWTNPMNGQTYTLKKE